MFMCREIMLFIGKPKGRSMMISVNVHVYICACVYACRCVCVCAQVCICVGVVSDMC